MFYSDKTWVFDQSERAQGPSYIINKNSLNSGLPCAKWTVRNVEKSPAWWCPWGQIRLIVNNNMILFSSSFCSYLQDHVVQYIHHGLTIHRFISATHLKPIFAGSIWSLQFSSAVILQIKSSSWSVVVLFKMLIFITWWWYLLVAQMNRYCCECHK